jgi:hypothetical protein
VAAIALPLPVPLDDATRPKAPPIPGATAGQRARGRRLALIHGLHREQLDEVRAVMEEIVRAERPASDLPPLVGGLSMLASYRRFGTLCGAECQMLTYHHGGEDAELFPRLLGHSPGLDLVVRRLMAEHETVHALIERLEAGAAAAVANPGPETFAALREVFEALDRVVRSHFGYEETELEEALGVLALFCGRLIGGGDPQTRHCRA